MLGAFKPEKLTVNGIDVSGWVAVSDKLKKNNDGSGEAIIPAYLIN